MAFFSIDKLSAELKIGTSAGSGVDAYLYTAGTAAHVGLQWDADGATEGMLIGGADDHGVDFKFFGETSGKYLHWDMSGDELVLASSAKLSFNDAGGGENIVASADGHLEVNAGTTLDMTAPTVDVNASTVLNVDAPSIVMASTSSGEPIVTIKNTHTGAMGGLLKFVNDKGAAGADNDVCGRISFWGDDDNQDNIEFVRIDGIVADASNGAEGGKIQISVASHDGELQPGLILADGSAEDEVDVTLGNGTSSVTSTSGTLTVSGNTLTFGNGATIVNTSADLLTITEAEVLLPTTTKLSFHDTGGGENIVASSDGHLEVNAGTTLDMTAPTVDINASTAVTIDTDTATFGSANSTDPLVEIKNTTNDANGARLRFVKDKGAAGANNDVSGLIEFYADDDGQNQTLFAKIEGKVAAAADGSERGQLTFYVAELDGTNTSGLQLVGSTTNDVVNATISAGAASITTITGNLNVTTVAACGSDVDKFLVYDGGDIKYRTGTQVASDISAVSTSSANTFTANQTFQNFIINTYDTVTYGSNSGNITATSANGTGHDPTSSSVFLQAVASSTDTTYHWDLSGFTGGGNGTALHLVFDKEDDTGITALQVNFGSNKLYSGNGKNDSLTFSTSGQSASLIYMDSAWRIINTGAAIS